MAGKASGAQFEISIDGKPRSYRDRKAIAIEAHRVGAQEKVRRPNGLALDATPIGSRDRDQTL
jgi:hypothetical protein